MSFIAGKSIISWILFMIYLKKSSMKQFSQIVKTESEFWHKGTFPRMDISQKFPQFIFTLKYLEWGKLNRLNNWGL